MRRLNRVFLYDDGAARALKIEEIAKYLRKKLIKVGVEVRGNPFAFYLLQDKVSDYARKIASIKIQDATKKWSSEQEPLYGEIEYEKKMILGKTRASGVLYDGLELQRLFFEVIPGRERSLQFVHIVFSNRLFATWDEHERRYHARVNLCGIPSIISTTGVVEAPAKPRGYYLLRQQYEMLGKDLLELKNSFKGAFIDYEDLRLTEVMKGYAMQSVFYSLVGDPFCQDKGCRLYNAHWQEELIFAQIESEYEFCQRHMSFLEELNEY
ncbi:MAG: hypothetical protein DRI01_03200 [Chloroflexi bacterium]|nr:MAG: hypothetical protein DRI01_03200 [Chloroflexota bacterium]